MATTPEQYAHIPGWGVDIDPKNDPTYPMRHREDERQKGYTWERPPQQSEQVEVLHSIERPNLSAVFGTAAPPTGLSGAIRRLAFKYSENHYGHWVPLLLADRVDVVEGVIADLRRGHIPNIFAEKGLKASWQHNRAGLIKDVLVTTAITVGVIALWRARKRRGRIETE